MLVCYIQEIGKMDVEIIVLLRKKPVIQPKEDPKDLSKMKLGKIWKDNLSVSFQRREGVKVQKCSFSLPDKHLYSTSCLNYILEMIEACKANDASDKKCFSDLIKWYIVVRNILLGLILKLFKVQKRQQIMKNLLSIFYTKGEIVRLFNILCQIYYLHI